MSDAVTRFYLDQLPEAQLKNNTLHAPCPFCGGRDGREASLVVFLQPDSFFHGYFRCADGCAASGFPLHFARLRGTRLAQVPGYDPDREYFGREVDYPVRNLNNELAGFSDKLTAESAARLHGAAITARTLAELRIGHNGRYLVYPYVQPDGNCYAARCVHPERPEDFFWYGDERFFAPEYRVFNAPEIDRCENGTLFVVEGEENLLCLKQLGLPGIAVPAAADLEHLDPRRFEWIGTLFLWVGHNAESAALARVFATRAGFKVRIVRWPENAPKSASLHSLATEQPEGFQQRVFALIREARAFSPFPSPAGEFHTFTERLAQEAGAGWAGLTTGFARLDRALGGLHGLNILGGTPKAGKSTFAIQAAADMAGRRLPVIYYDFENGRQKIYLRILSRLSRLPVEQIRAGNLAGDEAIRLTQGLHTLETLLPWLRVVNDRKLSPETMRRHIDFLRHETRSDYAVVVIDSLHKLPFKDISQKRSGIDGWLRQLEAIRDELAVSFLVISELERGPDGQFDRQPQLGSFKGSGDIGYSADNALVLLPQWDPFGDDPPGERANDLWVVASREHSPGLVGAYRVDYPFWGFSEE